MLLTQPSDFYRNISTGILHLRTIASTSAIGTGVWSNQVSEGATVAHTAGASYRWLDPGTYPLTNTILLHCNRRNGQT